MTVGFPALKSDIDNRAGALCLQLRDTLANIHTMNGYLVALGSQNLVTLGYTTGEATEILTNFNVLDQFSQVFVGAANIPADVDISGYVKPFIGVQ